MVHLKIKWNKTVFDNVEFDPSEGVLKLKENVYHLSGVPPPRQKLMAKGLWNGFLKDDVNISKFEWKDNLVITLIGNADIVETPVEKIQFLEDLSATEKFQIGALSVSSGLSNLGNTCYLNATIQCFRHMSDVRDTLSKFETLAVEESQEPSTTVCRSLALTYRKLDNSEVSVPPIEFVFAIRRFFPQFAERSSNGSFTQQDAEEFYNVITQNLTNICQIVGIDFKKMLGLQLTETLICAEEENELPIVRTEFANKIICVIQGGTTTLSNVDHLHDGLKLWMEGSIEKRSGILNRNALWNRKTRISSLPRHLCIQFMRFFWKETPDSADHQGLKCKILRPVTFPEVLDIYDYVTEDIQAALKVNREREDKIVHKLLALNTNSSVSDSSSMDIESNENVNDPELQNAIAISLGETALDTTAIPWGDNLPNNFTGLYEIESIVSHKGRSSDSGHYIAWVRKSSGSKLWWKYDDDKVTEVTTDEILRLKGGGDHDMSYLAFYHYKGVKLENN